MRKERFVVFLLVTLVFAFNVVNVLAQEDESIDNADVSDFEDDVVEEGEIDLEEIEEEFDESELEFGDGGIGPDSFLYGLDKFFDSFGDSSEVAKEKAEEIRRLIEEGKIEEAKEAFEEYVKHAEKFEKEVSPDERDKARRNAAIIHKELKDFEEDHDFIGDVLESQKRTVIAAEIAAKIKDLCEQLVSLDPGEFYRVCKIDEEGPRWQKDLFKDLSEEQETDARLFLEIMNNCFQTSGQECRCEEIPHNEFSNLCIKARPLAIECDVNNNKDACEELDEITENAFDLLEDAPHLQRILAELETFEEERFEHHIPKVCEEEKATTPRECMMVMFRIHAPKECIEALDRGEINFETERQAHKICEEIMFKIHAPEECVEKGITNHKECGKLMFELNAPPECKEAGLTGESQNDHRRCGEIKRRFHEGSRGPGPGIRFDCRQIEDSAKRLECYDKGFENRDFGSERNDEDSPENFGDFEDRWRETKERERECAERCYKKGSAWDFSGGECSCKFDDRFREEYRDEFKDYPEPPQGEYPYPEDYPTRDYTLPEQNHPTDSEKGSYNTEPSDSGIVTDSSSTGGSADSTSEDTESSTSLDSSSAEGSEGTITGGVISVDNEFYEYYFS